MTIWAYVAMYGWAFVAVPVLFVVLPARTAAFVGLVFGWLFLPFGKVDIFGPIELTKYGACSLPVLMAVLVFETSRVSRFRPSLLDLPMLLWVLSPTLSSMTNGLGINDSISGLFNSLTIWGIPYFIGRLYVVDAATAKHLALVIFFAGIAYVPFVMWEMRMSPRLHEQIYGYVTYEHGGTATRRLGGWRPVVFQQHGLMLGVVMASTAVVGGYLWWSKAWRRFSPLAPFGSSRAGPSWRSWSGIARRTASAPGMPTTTVPTWPLVFGLLLVAVMCRALNALALMVVVFGVLALLRNRVWPTKVGLLVLLLIPPVYVVNRLMPGLIGYGLEEPILSAVRSIDESRANSLAFRFDSENMLSAHALHQPIFGWSGWGRNRVFDVYGNDVSVTDGLWIIVLGQNGLFGLVSWYLAMLGPSLVLVRRYSAKVLASPEAAPAVVLTLVAAMFMVDALPNAMATVMYPLASGGVAGLLVGIRGRSSVRQSAPERASVVGA